MPKPIEAVDITELTDAEGETPVVTGVGESQAVVPTKQDATATFVVSGSAEKGDKSKEKTRAIWIKAVTIFLTSAGVDVSGADWQKALTSSAQQFQDFDNAQQKEARAQAYSWLETWLTNPQPLSSGEVGLHLIATFYLSEKFRSTDIKQKLDNFKKALLKLTEEAETTASASAEPAQPNEVAPEPAAPAAETGKTPEELATERAKWKKQIQDFLDSVGLEECPALGLSQQEMDTAIQDFQTLNATERQTLVKKAETWLAKDLSELSKDLVPERQRLVVAFLTIDTSELSQIQKALLDKLRVALVVGPSASLPELDQQLYRIAPELQDPLADAIRVQMSEGKLSDELQTNIFEVLSKLAIQNRGGTVAGRAIRALQSVAKKKPGTTLVYLERIVTETARKDSARPIVALPALQAIAEIEDSARGNRLSRFASDPTVSESICYAAIEHLLNLKEYELVRQLLAGRLDQQVRKYAAARLAEEERVDPSETPLTFGSDEVKLSAVPAQVAAEPASLVDDSLADPIQQLEPALLRPSEVADALGISGATLRRWTSRFSAFLDLPEGEVGGSRTRYTIQDQSVLAEIKKLLEQGLTYEQVTGQLAEKQASGEAPFSTTVASASAEAAKPLPDSAEPPPAPEPEKSPRQQFEQVIHDFLMRGDGERSDQAAVVAEILADRVSNPSLEVLFGQEALSPLVLANRADPIKYQKSLYQIVANRTLYALGITEASWQTIAATISERLPVDKPLDFGFTNQATLGHLREALVQQGFLDVKAVTPEPLPAPEPSLPPGSASEPGSETGAEFDEDFDAESVVICLTRGEDSMFCEGKKLEDFDLNQMVFYVTYLATIGLFPEKELIGVRVDSYFTKNPTVNDTLKSFLESLYSPDADVEALTDQLNAVVQACLAGDESQAPIQFLDGKTAEMGQKRLAAVIRKLHEVIISRQSAEMPVEELEKASEFDPQAVAEELANQIFPPELALENVTPAQLTVVVTVSYFEAIENNRQFGLYCDAQLNKDRADFFRCRDILYDPKANIQEAIELLNKVVDSVVEVGGETLHEGANLQVSRNRLAAVLTELHRILSERQRQTETVPVMDLRGHLYQTALNGTELDDYTRLFLDRLAERDNGVAILNEIRDKATFPEVRAHAAELLEKRKPVERLPEKKTELATANRARLIERAATLLLGQNRSGRELEEGYGRWRSVYYGLKDQCESRFNLTFSDAGEERLSTIVFDIFRNLDAMQNDDILGMLPEQRGERGELCAYGFDIEDEQSQRATVEYLIEIAATNGIRFLTDLRRYYGQRFANSTYELIGENQLVLTPNGNRLLKGEASALHYVASFAGINFLAQKGLLTDELLEHADTKTIEKFIQQKRWRDALNIASTQNLPTSEQLARLVFTALMDEYGPEFSAKDKVLIAKTDSPLFPQIDTILDLPHAGIDDVLHSDHWQGRFESLCFSLSQACGYGQNAELPAQFNQALNNFMSRIFGEEMVVQLTPAERDLSQRVVGVIKTNRWTSNINWVQQRWGARVDAIDLGLKFSLLRASDVAVGAEEDGDEKASALEEIRDFGLDPSSFETETDEDREAMWETVVDAFAELRDLPDDRVDQVATDLAIGLGALGTVGVLPPKKLCDDISYEQATDKLYNLYDQLEAGQEINPELARRALFTFWRSFWSADLPSSEAEMNSFIDEYQGTLADFLGLFAQKGLLS